MTVLVSDRVKEPIYTPRFKGAIWTEELGQLRYGLGNFYSLDGVITHYHNWYDRVAQDIDDECELTTPPEGKGFPLVYIKKYTEAFIADYMSRNVRLPAINQPKRAPRIL